MPASAEVVEEKTMGTAVAPLPEIKLRTVAGEHSLSLAAGVIASPGPPDVRRAGVPPHRRIGRARRLAGEG